MRSIALIVAGGRGMRAGGGVPKQYRELHGVPMLRHSVIAFRDHPRIDGVRVVIHPDDRALYEQAVAGLDILPPAHGGPARQDSVRFGLESLAELQPTNVLIHDGARPYVDPALITRVLDALASGPGAIPALPVTDTLKRGRGAAGDAHPTIAATVDRSGLWRAQTPQGFRFDSILAAHRAASGADLSDDAAVAERAGLAVELVMGSEDNLKMTTEQDFARAARSAGAPRGEPRVGQGFDTHKFGDGNVVHLCGVAVPHTRGLIGHSDADVGLHALTDALLGALGAGDIGMHFPPSDPKWRNADSAMFVRHALDLVHKAGGRVVHVDVTIICEEPKVAPHRAAMVARLSEILGIAADRCSVKATTTEGLGFTGRREGIAAQAVATIERPVQG
jgi:2-C-methyl-D-erythritol 4-phosphate cytidylyltransferase / 2-C-methyl-D-erythritol 2,4-cyclodiphosphate synthase